MDRGKKVNTNDPQEVAKALAQVGSSVLLANPKMGCAMALTNTGDGLEKKAHWFSTSHPITAKGALSRAARNELAASGLVPSIACGTSASTKRLVARGAMAAAFSGAMLFGMGATDAMARDFGFTYYGGTNPLGEVFASGAKPAFVDIDKDGDMDCFIGENGGSVQYWKNNSQGGAASFTRVTGEGNPFSDTDVLYWAAPTFVDIDGDGDMDAFIGHATELYQYWPTKNGGSDSLVSFIENTGTPQVPVFDSGVFTDTIRKTIPQNPLIVQGDHCAVPTFADIDGDGDMDAFVGDSEGYIRVYENVTGEDPRKVITATIDFMSQGLLPGNDGYPIYAYNGYAAPSFVDVDGDGDLDLFVGNKYGAIQYFQNTGTAQSFQFTEMTLCQNPIKVNPGAYSAPAFTDINGDGRMDAFLGASWFYGFGRKQEQEIGTSFYSSLFVRYYQNTGTATEPAFRSRGDNPFNLGPDAMMPSPALGDIDNDGDLDAIVGCFSPIWYNYAAKEEAGKGKPVYLKQSLRYYENTGTVGDPVFALWSAAADPWENRMDWYLPSPAIADLDGDGSNEVYVGYSVDEEILRSSKDPITYTSYIEAYQYITNTRSFVTACQNPLGDFADLPMYPSPAFVDVDGDGDLDVFISGRFEEVEYAPLLRKGDVVTYTYEADIAFYRNEGTAITPTFTLVEGEGNPLTGVEGMMMPRLSFADVDGDGDMDAVLSELFPYGGLTLGNRYFQNTGTKTEPVFEEREGNANPLEVMTKITIPGATALADLDNDKDVDAIVGDYFGKLYYFRNIKTVEEANAILKDNDDWLCFVDSAQSEVSLWNRLTESCKQGAQKIRMLFSPS
ncbi:MAG: VCBS repeat-containing protein [Desulfatibacillum sp.]|nr:VCBS repeat-containing protein [Desulfatibacillum sp.]